MPSESPSSLNRLICMCSFLWHGWCNGGPSYHIGFARGGNPRMRKMNFVPALVLVAAAAAPATSNAQFSANIGWVSEYLYRGIFQEDSSAFGGFDYAMENGFYAGTWGADVGDGLEYDLYFGFAGGDNFTYKIGFTGYYYSDDFDDTYEEVNLGYRLRDLRPRRRDRRVRRLRHSGRLHLHVGHDLTGKRPVLQDRQLQRRLRRRLLRDGLHVQPRRARHRSDGRRNH